MHDSSMSGKRLSSLILNDDPPSQTTKSSDHHLSNYSLLQLDILWQVCECRESSTEGLEVVDVDHEVNDFNHAPSWIPLFKILHTSLQIICHIVRKPIAEIGRQENRHIAGVEILRVTSSLAFWNLHDSITFTLIFPSVCSTSRKRSFNSTSASIKKAPQVYMQ